MIAGQLDSSWSSVASAAFMLVRVPFEHQDWDAFVISGFLLFTCPVDLGLHLYAAALGSIHHWGCGVGCIMTAGGVGVVTAV